MAKGRSTSSDNTSTSTNDRAIARTAANQALPYTDPRATYPRALEYQQRIRDGAARRGAQ
ncbi:hypothetical protein ACGFIW_01410 [Micromonospora sp. NPDC048935]|uniref:hypothetical protein n=1 Tax=Micromonospora sp. NPDC048935 TaxID=3364262 RepID=UPI00371C01D8